MTYLAPLACIAAGLVLWLPWDEWWADSGEAGTVPHYDPRLHVANNAEEWMATVRGAAKQQPEPSGAELKRKFDELNRRHPMPIVPVSGEVKAQDPVLREMLRKWPELGDDTLIRRYMAREGWDD